MIIKLNVEDKIVLEGVNRWFMASSKKEEVNDVDLITEQDILNALAYMDITENNIDIG